VAQTTAWLLERTGFELPRPVGVGSRVSIVHAIIEFASYSSRAFVHGPRSCLVGVSTKL
jgi:hypothetical protein